MGALNEILAPKFAVIASSQREKHGNIYQFCQNLRNANFQWIYLVRWEGMA